MANINELLTAIGFAKQTDIATANLVAGVMRVTNLNARPWAQRPINEDDSKEVGKGHEFGTALFKSHYDNPIYQLQKYCSSEILAWVMCFGLGKVVATTGQYVITPISPAVDGTELPYFSFIQQIRPGGSAVLDQMFVGCAVKAWKLSITNSPGRASAMISADLWHSGKYTEPSGISIPAAGTLHEMNAGSLTLTINGIDYVTTAKSFISLDMGFDNAFRPGFFPGSGSQDGYQIQGRAEVGDRIPSFTYVARFANGSTELTKLRALTTGTAVIGLTYDSNNSLSATWQKVAFEVVEIGDSAGIVTVAVTCIPLYDSTNGLFSATVKTPLAGIAA